MRAAHSTLPRPTASRMGTEGAEGRGSPARHQLGEVSLGALAATAEAPRTCCKNVKKQRALFKTGLLNSTQGENY